MHARIRLLALVALFAFALVLGGCTTSSAEQKEGETTEARVPGARGEMTDAPGTERPDGYVWRSRAYPTGQRSTSAIMIERGTPAEVQVGQAYDYIIRVVNLTNYQLEEVVVRDRQDRNFAMSEADPRPQVKGDELHWIVGSLEPSQTKIIRVSGMAKGAGTVTQCCDVEWESVLCATTKVVQPKLALVKTGTANALICDAIVYEFVVTNGGTGTARNVEINEVLPTGLQTLQGEPKISIPVGSLGAGESKTYTVRCKATKTGRFSTMGSAKADGLTAKSGTVGTHVTRPALRMKKTGARQAFIGREIGYEITLKNMGDGEARDTVIENPLPRGAMFVRASDGGKLDDGMIRWNLGTLEPNEERKLTLVLKASGEAMIRNTATAKAYCAKSVSEAVETGVVGIPAILLEVVDAEDPIPVGAEVEYVITVTNQGTAAGTNIRIVCQLEDTQNFVAASGATRGSHANRTVSFEPLRSLAPKAKATFRVRVKALEEGDVRFTVRMTSDQLKRPVQETEATNLYK